MLDLSARLSHLPASWDQARRGHEHQKGWGVFGLPFDSGDVLALRVVPESDFGPYCALWHKDPGGSWAIYVDGPRLDTACPRYFGAACKYTGYAQIQFAWKGPATLHVTMDQPSVDWTLTTSSTRVLDLLNALSAALPPVTGHRRPIVRAREWLGAALGLGRLELAGVVPSGHRGTVIPERCSSSRNRLHASMVRTWDVRFTFRSIRRSVGSPSRPAACS